MLYSFLAHVRFEISQNYQLFIFFSFQNPMFAQQGHNEQLLSGDKRLLVKVVSASQLGSCAGPFCVLEMDEPAQRNQTSMKKDTGEPHWDEHFLL